VQTDRRSPSRPPLPTLTGPKAPGYYVIPDRPARRKRPWPITAATFILMHKELDRQGGRPRKPSSSSNGSFEKGDKMAEELDYISDAGFGGQADREDLVVPTSRAEPARSRSRAP